jgi:GNAT superfamily N-acetyltransferase
MTTHPVPGFRLRTGGIADLAALTEVDDDAAGLYTQAGIVFDLSGEDDFVAAERAHWQLSLARGTAVIAVDSQGHAVGFAAVSRLDGQPYLAQLSVRRGHMRRGIGGALLGAARALATRDGAPLWLTTYDHLEWNRPFYERHGFLRVAETDCGAGLRAQLALERRWLPGPEKRIAMRSLPPA